MSRQDQFFSGVAFGLPTACQRVPFGQESKSRDELGLRPSALKLVVAVVAAEFTQMGGVTAGEIGTIIGSKAHNLSRLERAGWVAVKVVPGTTIKLYAPTTKAWKALGLDGWSLLKEVA